jgi:hypothetical protein
MPASRKNRQFKWESSALKPRPRKGGVGLGMLPKAPGGASWSVFGVRRFLFLRSPAMHQTKPLPPLPLTLER